MIKRKLFVAGMTAFAITTATGIAALASQGNVNRNSKETNHVIFLKPETTKCTDRALIKQTTSLTKSRYSRESRMKRL